MPKWRNTHKIFNIPKIFNLETKFLIPHMVKENTFAGQGNINAKPGMIAKLEADKKTHL